MPARRPAADSPGRPASGGPPGGAWASQFAQAIAETLAGARPPRQVVPWTTEQARRRIQRIGPYLQAGPRPVVRRVLTCAPSPDAVEMTVIVAVGGRVRAIAVRLERSRPSRPGTSPGPRHAPRDHPWVCTHIEAA